MPKKIIQDMVRSENRKQTPKIFLRAPVERELGDNEIIDYGQNSHSVSRYGLWFVALFSILFLLFSFSVLFAGAKITINPRVEELVLSQNFSAVKDGVDTDLPFDVVVISGEENKIMEGGEEKNVSLKAEGVAVIYNTFSSVPQALSIDTRLEGSNNKLYKTKRKITVPGMAKDGAPGTVSVEIYAAEAGEEYNSGPLNFKIFGFKGTPKYSKFYAKSNTDDEKTKGEIKGGFIGTQYIIPELEKNKLSSELKKTLQMKLFKKAIEQTPDGFILFKDAAYLNIDDENFNGTSGSKNVPVSVKGTLYGILFEEKALTKKIIKSAFSGEEGNDIYIQNIRDFNFSIPGMTSTNNLKNIFSNLKNVNFNLSGISSAVWKLDEQKLVDDVLAKKKKDFNFILSQYPNITSADLSLRPFWSRSLPEKRENIKVFVTYPE